MGLPFEHGLHSTLVTARLAESLGVDRDVATQAYYAALLSHAGCTTEAHLLPEVFGGSLTTHLKPVVYGSGRELFGGLLQALPDPGRSAPVRALQSVQRIPKMVRTTGPHLTAGCEVAQMIADRVGAPSAVRAQLAFLVERWDGKGPLRRGKGEEIPLPMRIVHVAAEATLQRALGGTGRAVGLLRERAGVGLDPNIATCLVDHADAVLALDSERSAWREVLAREPGGPLYLEGEAIDRALMAMGGFADLISPHFSGHSATTAKLAEAAALRCGLDPDVALAVRRAALVHDLGRVAIGSRVWEKPAPLNADEWEQVRLHPYHTERVLKPSPFLAALAPIAGAHHEHLDGSGYHRGARGAELPMSARILASADCYQAMCEPRPYRGVLGPERATEALAREANEGRLDPDAVRAVVEAAGQRAPRIERPAGLTEREAEVVGLLARGRQTKQVARELGVSAKTADRHIQNAYRKIGISSRAAATLFAMEHGLVTWGELPMADADASS